MRLNGVSRRYPDSGPELRYTNKRGHDLGKAVSHFHRLYNDDIYDLIKWGAEQRSRADVAEAERDGKRMGDMLTPILGAKLDSMELHDDTGDSHDEGYMDAIHELRDWLEHGDV